MCLVSPPWPVSANRLSLLPGQPGVEREFSLVEREFSFEKGMEHFEGVEKVGRRRPG